MVDSGTNVILHVRLYALRSTAVRKILNDGCGTITPSTMLNTYSMVRPGTCRLVRSWHALPPRTGKPQLSFKVAESVDLGVESVYLKLWSSPDKEMINPIIEVKGKTSGSTTGFKPDHAFFILIGFYFKTKSFFIQPAESIVRFKYKHF